MFYGTYQLFVQSTLFFVTFMMFSSCPMLTVINKHQNQIRLTTFSVDPKFLQNSFSSFTYKAWGFTGTAFYCAFILCTLHKRKKKVKKQGVKLVYFQQYDMFQEFTYIRSRDLDLERILSPSSLNSKTQTIGPQRRPPSEELLMSLRPRHLLVDFKLALGNGVSGKAAKQFTGVSFPHLLQ